MIKQETEKKIEYGGKLFSIILSPAVGTSFKMEIISYCTGLLEDYIK